MVKLLEEICLSYIGRHIKSYPRLGVHISSKHKAMLLERMCWHDLFTVDLLPSISYHLFADTLQHVNLSYSEQVNDNTMELLATCHCQPISLTIHDCPNVTDKGIEALSRLTLLIKVQTLRISHIKNLTGEGFKSLGARSITELILKECNNLQDKGFVEMIRRCPNVKILDVSWSFKLTDLAIITASETLGETLEEIHCTELTLLTCASTLSLAQWCPNIRRASFDSCVKLDGSGLIKLAETCCIEHLKVSFCYKVPAPSLDILITTLKAKGCLKSLELMGDTLGDFGPEFLASCRSLTRLFLSGVKEITDEKFKTLCSELGDVLIELDISTCASLSNDSCSIISKHTRCLEVLGMRNMSSNFTGMGLCPLFQDPRRAVNIRYVSFSGTKTISPIVVHLITTNCLKIETLLLAGVKNITDDIVFSLAHNCQKLRKCSLRNCDLSDSSICELSMYCNQLVMLALAGIHDLTDKCIISLAENCPYIKELYLSGCAKITKAALRYLKDCAVKSVWIKHAVPNAPIGLLMAKDLDTGEYKRMDSTDAL